MLTLADLGVLRDVMVEGERVVVTITPTYSGCPAMSAMRADLRARLRAAGYPDVEVRTVLAPAVDHRLDQRGRPRAARRAGVAPPGPAPRPARPGRRSPWSARADGRLPAVRIAPTPRRPSPFGSTACKALRRCRSCAEPFEHVKEI